MVWSTKYEACKLCGTTKHRYHGKGLCRVCFARIWRVRNPEKVSEQADRSYTRNYVLRNEEVLARRRERYRDNAGHRENAQENARRQYRKNPQLYADRAAERRIRVDRDAFERIKPSILKRDNYTCRECNVHGIGYGGNSELHVHHINLDGGDHRPENLITYCAQCHKSLPEHHAHRRKYS